MQAKIPNATLIDVNQGEGNDLVGLIEEALRMLRQPATRAGEVWSVEIVRGNRRPVILITDNFSRLPVEAYPTYGTEAHIVSILDVAGRLSGYPAKLWVSSDRLFESAHLETWATQQRIRVIFQLPAAQDSATKPLVEQLRRDCLNDLNPSSPAEMAWAHRCWRMRVIARLTGTE